MPRPTDEMPRRTLSILRNIEKLKHKQVQSAGLDPRLALLRRWQSERLGPTYAGFNLAR